MGRGVQPVVDECDRSLRFGGRGAGGMIDVRAIAASWGSVRAKAVRAVSYSSSRPGPNRRGSSALRVHRTPASSSSGKGWADRDVTTPRATLEVGQTSRTAPSAARRATRAESSTARTPWAIRRAPSTSSASRTEHVERGAHAGRAGEFPRVRSGDQPGITGDGECLGERLRRILGFVSGQAKGDHPVACPLGCEAGDLDSL